MSKRSDSVVIDNKTFMYSRGDRGVNYDDKYRVTGPGATKLTLTAEEMVGVIVTVANDPDTPISERLLVKAETKRTMPDTVSLTYDAETNTYVLAKPSNDYGTEVELTVEQLAEWLTWVIRDRDKRPHVFGIFECWAPQEAAT